VKGRLLVPGRCVLLLGLAAATSYAYTHFVHYREGQGYQRPIVEKFDLAALLDQRVYFYVSKDGPKLAPNDSFEALVSHVRQALSVWDAVPTSTLRVAYGGLTEGLPDSGPPAGEILFAELPPGVIGLGGPITWGNAQSDFVPIVCSQVILSNDLTLGSRPRQSFSELFFNSLVHEIGHALGLQHTLTSSVMSTDVTRATSRAQPLGVDDIAGISVLYPSSHFYESYGSITGRVTTTAGEPVHLASVVALNSGSTAVSALTAPDGTYRIDGLPAGPYQVYAHPLPPATQDGLGPANLVLPVLDNGTRLSASAPFKTTFFGNTTDWRQTPAVDVRAGAVTAGIQFQVTPTNELSLYGVTTYSFPGNGAPGVHPAFLDQQQGVGFVLAYGTGLTENLAGLTVDVLGGDLHARKPQPYEGYNRFARLDFDIDPFSRVGPKHLLFRLPGDIYVLPSGVHLTSQPAPVIHWMEETAGAAQEGVWSVHGINFEPLSTVYFDGLPAQIVEIDAAGNEIQVVPPPGPPGHRAIVTVYNPDGQSSALTLPDGNVIFPYFSGGAASLTMSPEYIHAGTDRVVEIRGEGVHFLPGETVVGFGNSEVIARYVDVLSPTHLRAVVTVPPESTKGNYLVSVTSGLLVMTLSQRLRTGEAPLNTEGGPPTIHYGSVVNSATMTRDLSPGVLASLFGENFTGTAALSGAALSSDSPRQSSAVKVTFNGQEAVLLSVAPRQINLQIPPSVQPGTAELLVYAGDAVSEPMLVELARVSPGVFGVTRRDDSWVGGSNPAGPGETLSLMATGLGNAFSVRSAAESGAQIQLGPARLSPEAIEPVANMPGLYRLRFSLPQTLSSTTQVSLLVDGRRSNVIELPVRR
jgi:uncharacterized protein (TIGR03437 family)